MKRDRIFLSGYRGTGKTTVGRLLAEALGSRCVDLDDQIEQAAGKSIRAIFQEGGEALFRDWESDCMRRVIEPSAEARVVALGGGAILREENRQLIAAAGRCVWLTARPETLARRLAADQATEQRRPALTDLTPADEIRAVLQQREPLYRGSADLIVDTEGKTPPQVAHAILTGVGD